MNLNLELFVKNVHRNHFTGTDDETMDISPELMEKFIRLGFKQGFRSKLEEELAGNSFLDSPDFELLVEKVTEDIEIKGEGWYQTGITNLKLNNFRCRL